MAEKKVRYEYKAVKKAVMSEASVTASLMEYAQNGWDLYTTIGAGVTNDFMLIFRREIEG